MCAHADDITIKEVQNNFDDDVKSGFLRIKVGDKFYACPLLSTEFKVDISGLVARVHVEQVFQNPTKNLIEAIYVFPLSHTSAVDEMNMVIGDNIIKGIVKRKHEAKEMYEAAIQKGQRAGLLVQERPNIFAQSIGNIRPGEVIKIEIAYSDVLKYDNGEYEFHLPTTIGQRYYPYNDVVQSHEVDTGKQLVEKAKVDEFVKIRMKSGGVANKLKIQIQLDAGFKVKNLESINHRCQITPKDERSCSIVLNELDSLANKDFILRYKINETKPSASIFLHKHDEEESHFMVMLQPVNLNKSTLIKPREFVFLIDTSGSMNGLPMNQVKESMLCFFDLMTAKDKFQIINFSSSSHKLFSSAVTAGPENIAFARNLISGLRGRGGTEMLTGIKNALNEPIDQERVRMIILLSDGFIGNEKELFEEVKLRTSSYINFWSIGLGSSPNRYLIDELAKMGNGGSVSISPNDNIKDMVTQVASDLRQPQLHNLEINWKNQADVELYPRALPNLWGNKPLLFFGKTREKSLLAFDLKGKFGDEVVTFQISTNLKTVFKKNDSIPKMWAKNKIEDLEHDFFGEDYLSRTKKIEETALKYQLVSRLTSLVAIDKRSESLSSPNGLPYKIFIPTQTPDGSFQNGSNANLNVGGLMGNIGGGGSFGSRTGTGRKQALLRRGGSRLTKAAIDSALLWLVNKQMPEGCWPEVDHNEKLKMSAVSILCLLANGHTSRTGIFKSNLKNGVDWLKAQQKEDGSFSDQNEVNCLSAIAILESYGMGVEGVGRKEAKLAIDYLIHCVGSKSYMPFSCSDEKFDAWVNGWFLSALKASLSSGINQNEIKITFKELNDNDRFLEVLRGDQNARSLMKSLSIIFMVLSGVKQTDKYLIFENDALHELLLKNKDYEDFKSTYFANIALYSMNGKNWKSWSGSFLKDLEKSQIKTGDEKGSWAISAGNKDGSAILETALNCLSLSVYFK